MKNAKLTLLSLLALTMNASAEDVNSNSFIESEEFNVIKNSLKEHFHRSMFSKQVEKARELIKLDVKYDLMLAGHLLNTLKKSSIPNNIKVLLLAQVQEEINTIFVESGKEKITTEIEKIRTGMASLNEEQRLLSEKIINEIKEIEKEINLTVKNMEFEKTIDDLKKKLTPEEKKQFELYEAKKMNRLA